MLLARAGLNICVLEKDAHPKFHIGESILPLAGVGGPGEQVVGVRVVVRPDPERQALVQRAAGEPVELGRAGLEHGQARLVGCSGIEFCLYHRLPVINSSTKSVEEMSTVILQTLNHKS